MQTTSSIAGYTYGSPELAQSPVSLNDLDLLKQTVLFTDDDVANLRLAGEILGPQVDEILTLWYGFVGSHPFLAHYFSTNDGRLIPEYLERVRGRFGQWILDTCNRNYDQAWLNYQLEIGLRHLTKKNQTDGVAAVPLIPLRYMVAFIFPITATIKSFLAKQGHSTEQVEAMYAAWFKSVVLQVTLWSYPYTQEGVF